MRLRIATYAVVTIFAASVFARPMPPYQLRPLGEQELEVVRDTLAAWAKYRGPASAECVDEIYSLQFAVVSTRRITELCGVDVVGCYVPAEVDPFILIVDHKYHEDIPCLYHVVFAHEIIHALDNCAGNSFSWEHADPRLWYELGSSNTEAEVVYQLIQRSKKKKRHKAAKRQQR